MDNVERHIKEIIAEKEKRLREAVKKLESAQKECKKQQVKLVAMQKSSDTKLAKFKDKISAETENFIQRIKNRNLRQTNGRTKNGR